jgi:hypothetical protein
VDPRAGLADLEKRKFFTLPGLELQPICHPARNQSLYPLRYPGSLCRVCRSAKLLHLFIVMSYKIPVNVTTNPNPVSS